MVKKKKALVLSSLLCLLPFLAGVVLYDELPKEIVIHWSMNGTPDGTSSRLVAITLLPGIFLGANLLLHLILHKNPQKENIPRSMRGLSLWCMPVLAIVVQGMVLLGALRYDVHPGKIFPLLLGVGFVLIGNYLPKCRQNYMVGIKLPWTLHSEENWNKTHRLAGYIWAAGGFVMIGVSLLQQAMVLMTGLLLVLALVPAGYSFYLYCKANGHND